MPETRHKQLMPGQHQKTVTVRQKNAWNVCGNSTVDLGTQYPVQIELPSN